VELKWNAYSMYMYMLVIYFVYQYSGGCELFSVYSQWIPSFDKGMPVSTKPVSAVADK